MPLTAALETRPGSDHRELARESAQASCELDPAAWLSELLACHAHDLGFPLAAEAYALNCYEHADQAGHDELCAWATDAMATMETAREQASAVKGIQVS